MKRMHIHLTVGDLSASVAFYAGLFAHPPTVLKPDYAKWMLDDPRVNFAISTYGASPGLNHLGIQVESEEESAALGERLAQLAAPVVQEGVGACCYAQSEKSWVFDPQGVPWETFRTMGEARVFADEARAGRPCCVPTVVSMPGRSKGG